MTALKTMVAVSGLVLLVGLGACTVYVVPAEDRERTAETLVEADEEGPAESGDTVDSSRPPERDVRRRGDAESQDSAAAVPEGDARAREDDEDAERQARAEAQRRVREEAERQAHLEAEREAAAREARRAAEREAAEQQARLAAEREAREATERAAREREARLQAETEAAEREAAARETAERAEREARLAARWEAARQEEAAQERAEREAGLAEEEENDVDARDRRSRARAGSRELHVPPGHHPPDGQCRIWYEDRPPGRQPAAAPCEELLDGDYEAGIFILYGGESWDGSHDWVAAELEHPGAVPRPVLALYRALGAEVDAAEGSEAARPPGEASEQHSPGSSGPPGDGDARGRSGSPPGPR